MSEHKNQQPELDQASIQDTHIDEESHIDVNDLRSGPYHHQKKFMTVKNIVIILMAICLGFVIACVILYKPQTNIEQLVVDSESHLEVTNTPTPTPTSNTIPSPNSNPESTPASTPASTPVLNTTTSTTTPASVSNPDLTPTPTSVSTSDPSLISNAELNNILIGVSSASHDFQRRNIIRTLQFEPYKNNSIDWRFFISNPGETYMDLIRLENNTYGDIIMLTDLQDTREIAREVKPFHFFKYVAENLKPYKYVAKMDDDTFINVPLMTKEFLLPNNTGVGEYFGSMLSFGGEGGCQESMGWFYALSWDLVLNINHMFATTPRVKPEEDFQVGWYLCQSQAKFRAITFTFEKSHDLSLDKNAWSRMGHPFANSSVCVHQLKSELNYIHVAQCGTSEGFNQTCIDERYEKGWN